MSNALNKIEAVLQLFRWKTTHQWRNLGSKSRSDSLTVAKKVISFTLITVNYLAGRSNCKSVALWVWDLFCDWDLAKSTIKLRQWDWEAGRGDSWWGDGWERRVRSWSVSDCQTVFMNAKHSSRIWKCQMNTIVSLSGIHQWQWKYCEKSVTRVSIFTKPLYCFKLCSISSSEFRFTVNVLPTT